MSLPCLYFAFHWEMERKYFAFFFKNGSPFLRMLQITFFQGCATVTSKRNENMF